MGRKRFLEFCRAELESLGPVAVSDSLGGGGRLPHTQPAGRQLQRNVLFPWMFAGAVTADRCVDCYARLRDSGPFQSAVL